jgi:hypothetical protein
LAMGRQKTWAAIGTIPRLAAAAVNRIGRMRRLRARIRYGLVGEQGL